MRHKIIFSEYSRRRRHAPRSNRRRGQAPASRLRAGRLLTTLAVAVTAVWLGTGADWSVWRPEIRLADWTPRLTWPSWRPMEAGPASRPAEPALSPAPEQGAAPEGGREEARPTPSGVEAAPPQAATAPGEGAVASQAPAQPEPALEPEAPPPRSVTDVVKAGETITAILSPHLPAVAIEGLVAECADICPLSQIKAGHAYKLTLAGGDLEFFQYDVSSDEKLVVRRSGSRYAISRESIAYEARLATATGRVGSNLFEAVKRIGESPELALVLADIFAWDIDFCRDIQEGDSFRVLVEKRYRRGEPAGYGRVLAAEFVNQGETYRAFLFEDGGRGGYYDEDGRALRKMFLKAPLSFRSISSGYSASRLHPILHEKRPHLAIDYAAPAGTEIWSVADGVVTEMGRNPAAGNYLTLRHQGGYETRYNHLSGYAKGLARGKRVNQGQVVAFVGSTGYATGPHLDFRLYKDGRPMNPQKLKSASAAPVGSGRREAFLSEIRRLSRLLAEEPASPQAQATRTASGG